MEYVVPTKPKYPSLDAAKKLDGSFEDKLKVVFNAGDMAGEVTREYLCNNFIYSANRIPEISETIVGIDNAMKWGYNHQLGPFETWDAVGVKEAVAVMKKLKLKVPKKIDEMLKAGCDTFYTAKADGKYYYDFNTKKYAKLEENPKIIVLPELKERKKVVQQQSRRHPV